MSSAISALVHAVFKSSNRANNETATTLSTPKQEHTIELGAHMGAYCSDVGVLAMHHEHEGVLSCMEAHANLNSVPRLTRHTAALRGERPDVSVVATMTTRSHISQHCTRAIDALPACAP